MEVNDAEEKNCYSDRTVILCLYLISSLLYRPCRFFSSHFKYLFKLLAIHNKTQHNEDD